MKIYHWIGLGILAVCLGCSSEEPQNSPSEPGAKTPPVTQNQPQNPATPSPAGEQGMGNTPLPPLTDPPKDMMPEKVLTNMVEAYRNATSYADQGRLRLTGTAVRRDGTTHPVQLSSPFSMSWVKPNQFAIRANMGSAICDGRTLYEYIEPLPNQVLQKPAPREFTIQSVFSEPLLADAMAQGPSVFYTWIPIQAVLLCADKPLNTLLYDVEKPVEMLEPSQINNRPCYRVAIYRRDGKGVFWIDAKSFVLRRFEYPMKNIEENAREMGVQNSRVVADFDFAELNAKINPTMFAFSLPETVQVVKMLAPVPVHMLGKPAPDFYFDALHGTPVTLRSLAGKTIVIDFWDSRSIQCRESLRVMNEVAQKFQGDNRVVFLTCNIDPKSQKPGGLDQKFKEWQISLPIYVDSQNFAKKGFRTPGVPATIIIGPKGKIQAYQSNIDPRHVFMLQQAVRAVADGKNVAEQQLGTFNMVREDYGVIFKRMVDEDLFVNPQSILRNIEIAGVAEQSAPKHFKMSQLWLFKKLEVTGNVLTLDDPPAPRILVCNNSRAVAEFDMKGQMLKNHQFRIPPDAAINNLRTAKTADGRRLYVGFAPSGPQCFLLDDQFQVKMAYPSDLKDSPPDGIADVQIADLTGDGTPEILVGYRGKAGVKAISLTGQELWANRDVTGITKMAIASRNPDSGPMLLCTSDKCLLFGLDGKGGIAKRWELGNRRFYWITADQPSPAGKVNLCGLAAPAVGKNEAIGLGLTDDMLWAYGLPDGPPGMTINRVTTGRFLPGQERQWVFLGTDSSIQLVSEQGKLIDRFNYGAFVTGIDTATINNRSVLIISSFRGVEAIALDPK